MVQERRRDNAQLKVVGQDGDLMGSEKTVLKTPIGTLRLPSWISRRPIIFILACSVLCGIIRLQPFDKEEESNCLAMLIFCTILWATEVGQNLLRFRKHATEQFFHRLFPSS